MRVHELASQDSLHPEAMKRRLDQLLKANDAVQAAVSQRSAFDEIGLSESALLRQVLDMVPDFLFVKDRDSRFMVANTAVASLNIHVGQGDLVGKTDFDLHNAALAEAFFAVEQEIMRTGEPMLNMEERVVVSSGEQRILSTSKIPLRRADGEIVGLVGVARDVTLQKEAEDQIRYLNRHDALTGLPKWDVMRERVVETIGQMERRAVGLALAYFNLDHFKVVNDSLGHYAGNDVLQIVARRLSDILRPSDTLIRLTVDEFVVLLIDPIETTDAIPAVVEALRSAVAMPIALSGQTLQLTCSVGLAGFPRDGRDADALLTSAYAAMTTAKQAGRDRVVSYLPQMDRRAPEKLKRQEEIRLGIQSEQFFLSYQPQVDLKTGRVFGVEALVRWRHPERGLVSPCDFIPLAEETSLIVQLGDLVLQMACRQNRAWQDAGLPPVTVSVNVSARQFREQNWIGRVAMALADSGLDGRYLELELTESMVMQEPERAVATMLELQAMGIKLSIDDFGTGYSSLSALKRFPVSRLKIDRSFINNLATDESDRAIASAVISLGRELKLKVIAEGVETKEQLAFLSDNNCDEMQGYYFSRPVDPDAIETLLRGETQTGEVAAAGR